MVITQSWGLSKLSMTKRNDLVYFLNKCNSTYTLTKLGKLQLQCVVLTVFLENSSLFNTPSKYWNTEHCRALMPIFLTNYKMEKSYCIITAYMYMYVYSHLQWNHHWKISIVFLEAPAKFHNFNKNKLLLLVHPFYMYSM